MELGESIPTAIAASAASAAIATTFSIKVQCETPSTNASTIEWRSVCFELVLFLINQSFLFHFSSQNFSYRFNSCVCLFFYVASAKMMVKLELKYFLFLCFFFYFLCISCTQSLPSPPIFIINILHFIFPPILWSIVNFFCVSRKVFLCYGKPKREREGGEKEENRKTTEKKQYL